MRLTLVFLLAAVTGACTTGGDADGAPPSNDAAAVGAPESGCADVVEVETIPEGGRRFRFDVTVRSADTGWERYADVWEVVAGDGTVLGTRVLAHPHVDEQPFTRSLSGVEIPDQVTEVVVRARDSVTGFCGAEVTVSVP